MAPSRLRSADPTVREAARMSVLIRPGRHGEAQALPDIERDAGRSFLTIPDLAWIAGDQVMSVEAHNAAIANGALWVAEDAAGAIVGFLSAELFTDALHVWEMAVRAAAQRNGIGARLIAASIDHARRLGSPALTLTTFRDVAWNAPFYERRGFRVLADTELSDRLREVLQLEVDAGLPAARRCAMRCDVQPFG
jgi:GNAT superfamily N-acetyltransferase